MQFEEGRKCLYEVLGVERFSTTDDIKKAYKRMALKFHPDKSPKGEEDAYKEKFQVINDAYQILSNPQDRAWYDDHREEYLNPNKKTENIDGFTFDVKTFCKESAYKDKNFYEVYSDVFLKILIEEEKYRESTQELYESRESFLKAPNFGNKDSDDDQVERFYSYWTNFVTCQTFGWADCWDEREADNRRERRFIQKTNNIERKKAKRKYNDLINELVSFVQFRDERYVRLKRKQQAEFEAKQEQQRLEKEKQQREWAEKKDRLLQEELERYEKERELRGEDSEDLEDEEEEERYKCQLCEKEFKSENQFKNHEKSKQHLKKKMKLMRELVQEGEEELVEDVKKQIQDLKKNNQQENKKKKKKKKEKKIEEEIEEIEDKPEELEKHEQEKEDQFEKEREEYEKMKKEKKQQKKQKKKDKKKEKELQCRMCNFKAESRTKLFAHLKAEHSYQLIF